VRRPAVALRATRSTGCLERSPAPCAVPHSFHHSDGTLLGRAGTGEDQTSRRSIR
jgi:hypothetical protein